MLVWSAGHNMPGYLPEGDPVAFETRPEAMAYTVEELRRAAGSLMEVQPDGPDEKFDRFVSEYEEAADSLEGRDAEGGDWYDTFEDGRIAYWFEAVDLPEDEAREALGED